jgi:plasmid maintenance system antidote protein VapI
VVKEKANMTSQEFLKDNPALTRESALRLVHEYDTTTDEFFLAFGYKDSYDTQAILEWLGF